MRQVDGVELAEAEVRKQDCPQALMVVVYWEVKRLEEHVEWSWWVESGVFPQASEKKEREREKGWVPEHGPLRCPCWVESRR